MPGSKLLYADMDQCQHPIAGRQHHRCCGLHRGNQCRFYRPTVRKLFRLCSQHAHGHPRLTTAWNANSTYNNGTVSAASPVYSVAPGTYSAAQSVSIASSTSSSYICYTLSTSTPTLYPAPDNIGGCRQGTKYTSAVSIPSTTTLYAVAATTNTGPPSTLVAGSYIIGGGCSLSSGATVSQIQTAINSAANNACPAPNTSTVAFAAGSYTISSQVNVPCPVAPMTITGPVVPYVRPASLLPGSYSYTSPYTATLNGTITNNFAWVVGSNGCTNPITIQYFNWNGNQPSGGGGGWIDVVPGESNLTVTDNYIHGNWGNVSASHNYDDLITLPGVGFAQFPINSGITITWNVFGDGTSDCNAL